MNSKFITTVAIASLLALPAAASAQDSGWYVRGNLGYGEFDKSSISGEVVGDFRPEADAGLSLAAGYDFGNNWRVELDGNSLWNDLGALYTSDTALKGPLTDSSFKMRTNALMLNGIYDFDIGSSWAPYIGAGLGVIATKLKGQTVNYAGTVSPVVQTLGCRSGGVIGGDCFIRDTDTNLGFQVFAGVDFAITPNLSWDVNFRYQNALDAEFDGVDSVGPSTVEAIYDEVSSKTLSTGFRYRFGPSSAAPAAASFPSLPIAANADYRCWDGTVGLDASWCPVQPVAVAEPVRETITCSDGTLVYDRAACPVVQPTTYTCWDNSLVYDQAQCPATPAPVAQYNICGPSPVAIFNVDLAATPKQLNRLGTMPEFGDSHGLSSDQFYEKLQARYAANNNGDRPYLNYLFKSIGYSNGFADAQSYMFTEETLPVGTRGLLGLGEQHHYAYHVLPTNDKDRQAFRIQGANGSIVHFMKTCGNYMYACN